MRSVTCMHALLRTLTLMDMGARGMGELDHDRERVGRPGLAFSRPKTSRKHREQHDPTHAWLSVIYGDGLTSEADGYSGASWSSMAPSTRSWVMGRSCWVWPRSLHPPLWLDERVTVCRATEKPC